MTTPAAQLLAEIHEQPPAFRQLLDNSEQILDELAYPGMFVQKLIGVGEGSSYNAIKIAAPFIEELTGLNTFTFDPESLKQKFEAASPFKHPQKRLFEKSYFMAVSQSGDTGSVVDVVGRLQKTLRFSDSHAPMITLTNNPAGKLPSRYPNVMNLGTGREQSIAATKSMTASILGLLLYGVRIGEQRAWLRRSEYNDFRTLLQCIPDQIETLLSCKRVIEQVETVCEGLKSSNQFVLLSKGLLSLTMPEAGLKLTETSSNIVWADNTESFKHGRKVILKGIEGAARPNSIYVVPPELTSAEADQFFADMQSHFFIGTDQAYASDGVFIIRFENSPALPDALAQSLAISANKEILLPADAGISSLFSTLVTFHLVSYYLAVAKGVNPNNPTLQKAVI